MMLLAVPDFLPLSAWRLLSSMYRNWAESLGPQRVSGVSVAKPTQLQCHSSMRVRIYIYAHTSMCICTFIYTWAC